ncbi:hypothetical protein BDR03DRAFT_953386 [Suillus americanus]|nr:hypothetical protein BDR03DRAFT_953386 [Suillus americanus]
MSRYTAWRAFGIVIFALCRLGVILVVMRLRPRTTSCSAPQFSRLSAVRIVCNSDETPSLLEGKTIDHVREVFDSAARRLFSDDAGLWPQYRTHYCVVVLLPLSNVSGDTASLGNRRRGMCMAFCSRVIFGENTSDVSAHSTPSLPPTLYIPQSIVCELGFDSLCA